MKKNGIHFIDAYLFYIEMIWIKKTEYKQARSYICYNSLLNISFNFVIIKMSSDENGLVIL